MLIELNDRQDHFLAPFVGAWHQRVLNAERVDTDGAADAMARALGNDLESIYQYVDRGGRIGSFDLNDFRHAAREALSTATGDVKTYHLAALHVLRLVIHNCWIPDSGTDQVTYFHPIFSATPTVFWIATLNYDNTIELAAQSSGASIDRGIAGIARFVRFHPDSRITVAKLHGSLDWAIREDGNIEIIDAPHRKSALPALIFGAGNKLRIAGPYLDLLFAFRSQLDKTDVLYVCGYSFRDVHINYSIYLWFERDSKRRVIVADPNLSLETLAKRFSATINEAEAELIRPMRRDIRRLSQLTLDWYSAKFSIEPKGAKQFVIDVAR